MYKRQDTPEEGSVVKGKVIAVEAGFAIVDVGYKMEGRVELKEFADPGEAPKVAVGDEVEVFLRQVENSKVKLLFHAKWLVEKKLGIDLKKPIPMMKE